MAVAPDRRQFKHWVLVESGPYSRALPRGAGLGTGGGGFQTRRFTPSHWNLKDFPLRIIFLARARAIVSGWVARMAIRPNTLVGS